MLASVHLTQRASLVHAHMEINMGLTMSSKVASTPILTYLPRVLLHLLGQVAEEGHDQKGNARGILPDRDLEHKLGTQIPERPLSRAC